jgi:pyruvate carboxylase
VFDEYRQFVDKYGDVSMLPTRFLLSRLHIGEEINVSIEPGKTLIIKLLAIGEPNTTTGQRDVFFLLNGQSRVITVADRHATVEHVSRQRANPSIPGEIGAPMSGVVVELRVSTGTVIKVGDPIAVLSAMKMETVVSAPCSGKVDEVLVSVNESLSAGDLICRVLGGSGK